MRESVPRATAAMLEAAQAKPSGKEAGSKNDRIARLEPDFRGGKFFLPKPLAEESEAQKEMRRQGQEFRIFTPQKRVDQDRRVYSLLKVFVDEFIVYPYSQHDDFLDATSRIFDMSPRPPEIINQRDLEPECFVDGS